MKKSEAEQLVINTFTHAFSEDQFTTFIRNLLPGIQAPSTRTIPNAQLPQGFREHVHNYTRLGTYRDPQGVVLDVVVVKLKSQGSLDRARTRQRNLMAHYLNRREKDAVLVAYIADDPSDWRFSYVKLAFQTEITDQGKVKVQPEYTPARRYSFLVGEHEPNHTAQKQLGDLLMNEGRPTLKQVEEVFNIETVTKEFFEQYKSLFLMIKENLDQIVKAKPNVKAEFERCEIDTANFAKKLLGQIVFLYFLQKKGWLGVAEDQAWGTGDKKFLSNLFEKNKDKNFFDEILEPFFYEALAMERKGDFYPALQCKVPFLNGGLFEPLNGYDWEHTSIGLDNKDFEKIFRVFNLYNFTVREDEPLEKEVAVDPEMLGKVFENLLEVKDRKSKGAFYTPREIVHYMCQESLINYLDSALNLGERKLAKEDDIQSDLFGKKPDYQLVMKEKVYQEVVPLVDIETFIREGEISIERDQAREEGKLGDNEYGLPKSVRDHAKEIDFALADVRVCDPAIGSGAFLVGMMTEIVRARRVLTPYLSSQLNRDPYTFKWHCIENSLYGVDIDPSAVEIAKLRLWLSLVVDEESYDQIRPLPNLDYRIVCGDSLQSVQKNLFNYTLYPALEKKKLQYFGSTSPKNKAVLRREIDGLITQLSDGNQTFDFEVYFSEVFSTKKGFDISIGNPPYVSHDKITDKNLIKKNFVTYEPFADLYCYFFETAIRVGHSKSIICLITSNSYIKADYGKPLRKHLAKKTNILGLINIEDFQIFESAIVNVAISIIQKKVNGLQRRANIVNEIYLEGEEFETFLQKHRFSIDQKNFEKERWVLQPQDVLSVLNKILSSGKTLEQWGTKIRLGLATGANYAFVITEEKKNEFEKLDNRNKQIIKPALRGRDIDRYSYQFSNEYILLTRYKIDVPKEYPTIYDYLLSFGDEFKQRGAKGRHWTNLRACAFYDDFLDEKIIWIELTDRGRFALCSEEIYLLNSAYFLIPPNGINSKYLLGILNSKVIQFVMNMVAETSGMGTNRWINNHVKNFPIPKENGEISAQLEQSVSEIILTSNYGNREQMEELEAKIDQVVYKLYGLTEEEIAIVEESVER